MILQTSGNVPSSQLLAILPEPHPTRLFHGEGLLHASGHPGHPSLHLSHPVLLFSESHSRSTHDTW